MTEQERQKVGFIGLGIMGRPMAKNLLREYDVWASDLAPAAVDELKAAGAHPATPAEIARECDVICTMLPNGDIVMDVLDGIAGSLRHDAVVIDLSSVTPEQSRACADRLRPVGASFLDAPVSGGEPKAIDGTLAIMVGGPEAAVERVRPVLECMGSAVTRVGETGAGSVTKLANQIIVNLTIAAVGEAMVFAAKGGVDVDTVYSAIKGGLAGSTVLDAKAPMMARHDFRPGGTLAINKKDIGNVLATAEAWNLPTPLAQQLFGIMEDLASKDRLGLDHSALVTHFEDLAGVSVESPRKDDEAS